MSHNCGGTARQCARSKPSHHKHCRKCRSKGCCNNAQQPVSPLFPGDVYGQPSMTSYGSYDQGMACNYGGYADCGSSCGCSDNSMSDSCSSCGGEMQGMEMQGMAISGQHNPGCGCGQHSSMEMSNPGFAPQHFMTPTPQPQSLPSGTPAPLPPAEVFQAPKSDGTLPPVPSDAPAGEGAPAASPAVDPVSWVIPAQPAPSAAGRPAKNINPVHRVEQIPTTLNR